MSEYNKKEMLIRDSELLQDQAQRMHRCLKNDDKDSAGIWLDMMEGTVNLIKTRMNESEGDI